MNRGGMPWWAGVFWLFVLLGLCFGISWLLVDWAFDTDVKNAETYCAQFGAEPQYTYRTRYICVTPDGRVVG